MLYARVSLDIGQTCSSVRIYRQATRSRSTCRAHFAWARIVDDSPPNRRSRTGVGTNMETCGSDSRRSAAVTEMARRATARGWRLDATPGDPRAEFASRRSPVRSRYAPLPIEVRPLRGHDDFDRFVLRVEASASGVGQSPPPRQISHFQCCHEFALTTRGV